MNPLVIRGNWNEVADKLKQQFTDLTDDDLLFKKGEEKELSERLQNRLGTTNEELRKIISTVGVVHHIFIN